MEQILICAILSGYAIFVDLSAAILRSTGDIYQTGPLTIWGVIISVIAIVEILLVFRSRFRNASGQAKNRSRSMNSMR